MPITAYSIPTLKVSRIFQADYLENGLRDINSFAHVSMARLLINPSRTKLLRGNINIYLHFVSFLYIDTTRVVEILPQIRQDWTTYFI